MNRMGSTILSSLGRDGEDGRGAMEERLLDMTSMGTSKVLRLPTSSGAVDFTHFCFSVPVSFPLPLVALPAQAEPCTVAKEINEALEKVQRILGYSFRNLSLLEEALTHCSYAGHASYQRLEFVGDAVLNLAFTNFVFLTNDSVGPGALSVLRSANVSTEKLARVAIRHDFYTYLRRNCPMLDCMVKEFAVAVSKERDDDYGELPYGGSTVKAPKVLADIVESIAAAIYIDCQFDLMELWKVFRGILEPIITMDTLNEQPVTHLYELCQKQGMSVEFKHWRKDNQSLTNVFVDGMLLGIGSSEQKHIAKLNAARDALRKMFPEANHMEFVECSSQACVTSEDQRSSKQLNGGLINKTHTDEREVMDCSKQRLNELCSKKHWQKPVYRLYDNKPSSEVKEVEKSKKKRKNKRRKSPISLLDTTCMMKLTSSLGDCSSSSSEVRGKGRTCS